MEEREDGATLAIGLSEYLKDEDDSALDAFARADRLMYRRKNEMKLRRERDTDEKNS